jgi:NTE family protein
VEFFFYDVNIEETKTPFSTVAVDLISGKELVLRHGSIAKAVMDSCAVPGLVLPVSKNHKVPADVAILNSLIVRHVKDERTGLVIAVDVGGCLCEKR